MRLCAIVPVKSLINGKSRLAKLLSVDQRSMLCISMLKDVLSTLVRSRLIEGVAVVTSDSKVKEVAYSYGATVLEDREQGVNNAVAVADSYASNFDASLVLPQDIPLVDILDIEFIYNAALYSKRCVVITPSWRLDGTNALLRRGPKIIETHYDEDSYTMHIREALEKGVKVKILLSKRVMQDIDDVDDLYSVLNYNNWIGMKRISYTKEYIRSILK